MQAIFELVVPHGFKTFILLSYLICLWPYFKTNIALYLLSDVKPGFLSLVPCLRLISFPFVTDRGWSYILTPCSWV